MSTIDTLLDKAINNGDIVLTIDEPTREIRYTGELLLGVEGDCQAEKIYFEAPKTVGNFIDLQAESTLIYVDFKNAEGEPYFIECGDREYHEDTDTVSFSWLLTERVAVEKGTVKFRVCVKTDEDEPKEWHTSIFTGKILEGINVEGKSPEIVPDETITTYQLIEEIKVLQARLADIEKYADSVVNNAITSKGYITEDAANATFATQADAANHVTKEDAEDFATKNDIKNHITKAQATKYLVLNDIQTNDYTDGVFPLEDYLNGNYNEVMLVIITSGNGEIQVINRYNPENWPKVTKEVSGNNTVTKVLCTLCNQHGDGIIVWDVGGVIYPSISPEAVIQDSVRFTGSNSARVMVFGR